MDKAILILLVFVMVLVGTFTYIYFNQQDEISNPQEAILTVSAESNGKKIFTGFKVNGEEFNTSTFGYSMVKVPRGYLINIENVNLEGQSYYKEFSTINISENVVRHDLLLKELKNLTVKVKDENPVNLTIYSDDYRDLRFCLIWSLKYIFVNSPFQEIEKPTEFKGYDRCYKTDISLLKNETTILINYQELGVINEKDYINVTFFNEDLKNITTSLKIK